MRVRNVSFRLVLPALLIGLVVLLAVLQYQWLGKVSEAERAQMLQSLTQRAREFAEDFDGELTQLYLACQVSREAVAANQFDDLADAISRWQASAKFPQLVRGVYLAQRAGDSYTLRVFGATPRSFSTAPLPAWPPHLEPVLRQWRGNAMIPDPRAAAGTETVSVALTRALPDVPALVIPVSPLAVSAGVSASRATGLVALAPTDGPPASAAPSTLAGPASSATLLRDTLNWARGLDACLIVDLDAGYLKTTVLRAMAARHFPDLGTGGYRMAVLSAAGVPLFSRDVPAGQVLTPERADVTQTFFSVRSDLFGIRPPGDGTFVVRLFGSWPKSTTTHVGAASNMLPDRMSVTVEQRSVTPAGSQGPASAPGQFRILMPSWRLVLQHASGSLDAAVSQARQRNLWLSFGILGVLTAGLVIVIVNARRAEQLAARRMDFVATVSHELRTPLAVIRSAAQNLSAGVVSDPAHARRYGELIDGEGRRLTDMVEQVMALAGLESGRPLQGTRPVDVPALVSDVMTSCASLCDSAGITVEVAAGHDAGIPAVMADEVALRRALQNLVTNAVKHGADGHWIGVTVSAPAVRGAREVQIVVSDRGRGIDAADLSHVFEPFHRGRHAAEQQVHGNGLGLHLVRLIASAHGGRVSVQSTPGNGATFTLHLPAAPSESSATT